MNKPTQEQIKEFWEWCGLKWESCHWDCPFSPNEHSHRTKTNHIHLVCPDGLILLHTTGYYLPAIDLNNLFKYAVPKLNSVRINLWNDDISGKSQVIIWTKLGDYEIWSVDPALALFWAIWEIIKKE